MGRFKWLIINRVERGMTCTNQQVKILMKELNKHTLTTAAAKAGMDVKTGRKYRLANKLPSEMKLPHYWKKRNDPFNDVWGEVAKMLEVSPQLQAKTVLIHLQGKYFGSYPDGSLRTLQRRFKLWRAQHGADKAVIFPQVHQPGFQSQSDYTDMSKLNITIQREPFSHLLFHFMLVYSRWEYVEICYSETFDSLMHGFENAVWQLGYVAADHRTDNLSAATKLFNAKTDKDEASSSNNGSEVKGLSEKEGIKNNAPKDPQRTFTERWSKVMSHYKVRPSRNNPGESNENGSVEKSHDLFKNAVDQQLMLRGSRDFESLEQYQRFLRAIYQQRNQLKKTALLEEIPHLHTLPDDRWYSPKQIPVTVSPASTVHVLGIPYSVPSRLIALSLRASVYPDKIDLFYGQHHIQQMPKIEYGFLVDYRHIINSLIRKPGAFKHYQYQAALFPRMTFRNAYDSLRKANPVNGHKDYLKLLWLAKQHGESLVNTAIELLLAENIVPVENEIKPLLDKPIQMPTVYIQAPNLSDYDQLRTGGISLEVAI